MKETRFRGYILSLGVLLLVLLVGASPAPTGQKDATAVFGVA